MRFHTFGKESGKVIVLIHGMLNPWQSPCFALTDCLYMVKLYNWYFYYNLRIKQEIFKK